MTTNFRFQFRVRTASGSIVNVNITAHDLWQAQAKVQARYPGCTIIQGHQS